MQEFNIKLSLNHILLKLRNRLVNHSLINFSSWKSWDLRPWLCIAMYHACYAKQRIGGCRYSCTKILENTLLAKHWALTDADACICTAGNIELWWRSTDVRKVYSQDVRVESTLQYVPYPYQRSINLPVVQNI